MVQASRPNVSWWNVNPLLKELRHNRMLWLLALVPVVLVAAKLLPAAHTLLFVLSVLAIVPLAALLSHATESVAEKTGDAAGMTDCTRGRAAGVREAPRHEIAVIVLRRCRGRYGDYMSAGTVKPDLWALFTFIHSFVRPEEPILSSRPMHLCRGSGVGDVSAISPATR
jgi:hypothetical protein